MSLVSSKGRLIAISKDLSNAWRDTKTYWRDAKAREFESKYIVPLIDNVESAATAIDKLDKILAKVRNDCEPDS